jgi:hypothetical protein
VRLSHCHFQDSSSSSSTVSSRMTVESHCQAVCRVSRASGVVPCDVGDKMHTMCLNNSRKRRMGRGLSSCSPFCCSDERSSAALLLSVSQEQQQLQSHLAKSIYAGATDCLQASGTLGPAGGSSSRPHPQQQQQQQTVVDQSSL